jgi:hypothetical protein
MWPLNLHGHILQPWENLLGILPGDLKVNLGVVPIVLHSVHDVELVVDLVQKDIFNPYFQNCPARVALFPRFLG